MQIRACLAALFLTAVPMVASVPAAATPVVNTYRVVSLFGTGAIPSVTQQFSLAFDPGVTSSGAVQSYSSSVAGASFNPGAVIYSLSTSTNPISPTSTLNFGGAINGIGVVDGTPDFQTFFFVTPTTGTIVGGVPLIPFSALTRYSTTAGTFETTNVVVTLIASSVPEAATWVTMIAGFGVAGAGLRVRRRRGGATLRAA